MKCPHCLVEIHVPRALYFLGDDSEGRWGIEKYLCPNGECQKLILYILRAELYPLMNQNQYGIISDQNGNEKIFYRKLVKPKGSNRAPVPNSVPSGIASDYTEACVVLPDSPKASAALSRRCLQNLLRTSAGVKNDDLAKEIQQVLDSHQLPSHLAESIDAIRNIGNYAAHPAKSRISGEIVEVEPGEAEWNLEVLESLFDFYYVLPEKTKQRREALNEKMKSMGKPGIK